MMAANLHNIYIHIEHIMINTLVRIMFMIMRAIYVTTVSSQKNSIVASIVSDLRHIISISGLIDHSGMISFLKENCYFRSHHRN